MTTNKLSGSEKQIAWASELLEGATSELSTRIDALQSAGDVANAERLSEVRVAVATATNASIIIDAKNLSTATFDAAEEDCRSRRSVMTIVRKTNASEWPKERYNAACAAWDASSRLLESV